jgi:homoserine kinase type II
VFSAGNALAWIATDRGSMIAKWSVYAALHDRLEETSRLTSWLARSGYPVSAPIPLNTGAIRLRADGASIELQAVIDGFLLDPEDSAQAQLGGATLARLHGLLAAYPRAAEVAGRSSSPKEHASLTDRVRVWLESEAAEVPPDVTGALARLSDVAPSESPPSQLVHGDYRSANLLCTGSAITAVLDFEEVAADHCVMDLAKASVLLGTRFRDWRPIAPSSRRRFLEGYQSVRPLSAIELGWIDVLVLWWTLQAVAGGWWSPESWLASAREQISAYS